MRLCIPVCALLAAGAAEAQPVPVRTGEHDGFTRIVLAAPDIGDWSLDPAPGGFDVIVPGTEGFDLDGAFARLSRGRLASIESAETRLALGVACDCHAKAEVLAGVGLVVDILDGPAPPGGLAPGAADRAPVASLTTTFVPPEGLGRHLAAPPEALSPATPRIPGGTDSTLAQGVASALSQGLLDIVPGRDRAAFAPPSADEAPPPPEPPPSPALPPTLPATPGLAFRTGGDVSRGPQAVLASGGTPCLPADAFDLAAWAGSGVLSDELAKGIEGLTDARDRLDPDAVEALARTYLAFGFGREAAVALDLDGRASRERDRLRLLGHLLDDEAVDPAALDDQAACLGPVALWRALARNSVEGLGDDERAAVSVALRDLPPAVRGPVALRVADLHLADDDPAAAAEAAALAAKGGTDARLAEARAARGDADAARALAGYGDLIDHDAHPAPDAMVELIDLSIAEDRPVPEATLELLRSLRAEHGGAEARALLLAEGRALAAEDRFAEALTLLDAERAAHPGPDIAAAMTATVLSIVERTSDAAFLELALGGLPDDLPSEARAAVASRLDALGFPQEARVLGSPAPAPVLAGTPRGGDTPLGTGPEPEAAALDPATLAARRDLLAEAEEARGRAEAILLAPPSPAGP